MFSIDKYYEECFILKKEYNSTFENTLDELEIIWEVFLSRKEYESIDVNSFINDYLLYNSVDVYDKLRFKKKLGRLNRFMEAEND